MGPEDLVYVNLRDHHDYLPKGTRGANTSIKQMLETLGIPIAVVVPGNGRRKDRCFVLKEVWDEHVAKGAITPMRRPRNIEHALKLLKEQEKGNGNGTSPQALPLPEPMTESDFELQLNRLEQKLDAVDGLVRRLLELWR